MTYDEFIAKYKDKWSGDVNKFKSQFGGLDEDSIDWLFKHDAAVNDGDVDVESKLFAIAPLALRKKENFRNRALKFFEQYIKPQYSDPRKQNEAFTAFVNHGGFPSLEAAATAEAKRENSGNPILPMSDADVKAASEKRAAAQAKKPVTPQDVKANAQIPVQQKSIAEQQAEYLRSRGMRTAADVTAQDEYNRIHDYKEATGFDISTAEGRRLSERAALQRGGHARAMAYYDKGGEFDKLKAHQSEKAYAKLYLGKNYVGENPITGAFRDGGGVEYQNKAAFDRIQALASAERGLGGVSPSDSDTSPAANTYRSLISETTYPSFSASQEDVPSAVWDDIRSGKYEFDTYIEDKRQEDEAQQYANDAIDRARSHQSPIGPTNGPENLDFGPLRRARATFYANKGVSDAAMAPTNTFDPVSAVRNMGSLPSQMEPRRINQTPFGKTIPPLSETAHMSTQGLPMATPMKKATQRIRGQGYRYPNIPYSSIQ